jgi:hypothetical protein
VKSHTSTRIRFLVQSSVLIDRPVHHLKRIERNKEKPSPTPFKLHKGSAITTRVGRIPHHGNDGTEAADLDEQRIQANQNDLICNRSSGMLRLRRCSDTHYRQLNQLASGLCTNSSLTVDPTCSNLSITASGRFSASPAIYL